MAVNIVSWKWLDNLPDEELKRLIERARKLTKVNLQELPLAELKRWLELNWTASLSELILPGSITEELLTPPEAPRLVGQPGQPPFQNSWVNFDGAAYPTGRAAYFYKHLGRVHFSGVVKTGTSGTVAFTLPPGYRPIYGTNSAHHIVVAASGGHGYLSPSVNGDVLLSSATGNVTLHCFLDGASFRHAT